MRIKKSEIPLNSLTRSHLPVDYSDVYVCETTSEKAMHPDSLMVGFWTDFPWWIKVLFKWRDFFAKFAGLTTTKANSLKEFETCIRTGGTYGFASVPAKNSHETVLLLTDKHLDAYVSVHLETQEKHKTISLVTLVNFKNKLGRVYFFIVRPFHGFVVKSLLKRTVNNLMRS